MFIIQSKTKCHLYLSQNGDLAELVENAARFDRATAERVFKISEFNPVGWEITPAPEAVMT